MYTEGCEAKHFESDTMAGQKLGSIATKLKSSACLYMTGRERREVSIRGM